MPLIKPFFGFLAGTHASFGVGLAFWVCLCLVLRQRKAMGKKKQRLGSGCDLQREGAGISQKSLFCKDFLQTASKSSKAALVCTDPMPICIAAPSLRRAAQLITMELPWEGTGRAESGITNEQIFFFPRNVSSLKATTALNFASTQSLNQNFSPLSQTASLPAMGCCCFPLFCPKSAQNQCWRVTLVYLRSSSPIFLVCPLQTCYAKTYSSTP